MIVRSAIFELSAVKPTQWPQDGLPEFAFVGRSNVGKSSLLNRLLGRKSLARVSATPGKTQQINFFRINEMFRFADLPGYGYAALNKRDRQMLARIVETYLQKRRPLVRVMHLIDIRHEPSAQDCAVHEWMAQLPVTLCVVATKQDKISKQQVKASVNRIQSALGAACPILPVSSEKNFGMDELWNVIEQDLEACTPTLAPPFKSDTRLGDDAAEKH